MKTITYKQLLEFNLCWLNEKDGRKRLKEILPYKEYWSALDILRLEEISADCRIWIITQEELVDESILHEFACRCTEEALSHIKNPYPRAFEVIEVKRRWLRGKASDEELDEAYNMITSVFDDIVSSPDDYAAYRAVIHVAWDTDCITPITVSYYAALIASSESERLAIREHQIEMLIEMLTEQEA